MPQVNFYRNDTDGLPIEHDPATDDLTLLSLTMNGPIAMGGNQITGLANGTANDHAVNLGQLNDISGGLDWKESVRLKTVGDYSSWTAAGSGVGKTLTSPTTATSNNDFDGVTVVVGDRILVDSAGGNNSTADADNGIYTVTQLADGGANSTILTRATDQDEDAEYTAGNTTYVEEGSTCADTKISVVTNNPITVDTTAVLWSLTGAGGSSESEQTAFEATAGAGGVTKGDPVYVSADNTVLPTDNTDNNTRKYVGVAQADAAAAATVKVQQDGILEAANVAGGPAAGDIVWNNTPNGTTVTLPTGSGTHRMVIGKMLNTTDLIIEPQYITKLR